MCCSCTLVGTKACENCSSNTLGGTKQSINYHWADDFFKIFELQRVETYNPETHELVEKKEAKINRIKASIEASERQKQNNEALIQQCYRKLVEYKENISTCEQDIEKLTKELKELE